MSDAAVRVSGEAPVPGELVSLTGDAAGVRTLTLNDHARRNAISAEMEPQLGAAVAAVAADAGARVLIVAGAGSAFCAGADLAATFGGADEPLAELRRRLLRLYDSFLAIARLEIPTIAAVQGAAVGAGVNLALACDLRIAGPQARFGITFSRLGLHPGGGAGVEGAAVGAAEGAGEDRGVEAEFVGDLGGCPWAGAWVVT